jgi:hypothetical protein
LPPSSSAKLTSFDFEPLHATATTTIEHAPTPIHPARMPAN